MFLVAPSEYTGEGWLTGRVVLLRLVDLGAGQSGSVPPRTGTGLFLLQPQAGEGKSGCKGKGCLGASALHPPRWREVLQDARLKCEVHLLGGKARGEVVFCEAWGEAAGRLHTVAKSCETEGKLLCLSNVKIVHQYNQNGAPRLPYYVCLIAPKGQVAMVEAEGRWADIPGHHPFLDTEQMTMVVSHQQYCVVGAR